MAVARLARRYLRLGTAPAAHVLLEGLVRVAAQEPYAWLALGLARDRMSDAAGAAAAYGRASELSPRDPRAPLNLAEMYAVIGDRHRATQLLQQATDLARRSSDRALLRRAEALSRLITRPQR